MPMITLDYFDLRALLGRPEVTKEELIALIPTMGADFKRVEMDDIHMEFFPNRPDLYNVEGVARALKAFTGARPGLREYEVHPSKWEMSFDPAIIPIRPFVACAYVTNVVMDDYLIRSLMNMQEKLHLTLGRDRKKVSIGVHDTREILPPVAYSAADPSFRFVPLASSEEMSMREVLEKHPKGIAYKHLVDGFQKYPLITDSNGKVLSFPPIINGVATTVREDTTELFLDVTGTDWREVNAALNIVATALAERGAKLHSVTVHYPDGDRVTPDLRPREVVIDAGYPGAILGIELSPDEIVKLLAKMGFGASADGQRIRVLVPAYRDDILHPVDIVEDIGIAYGFENFPAVHPKSVTYGARRPVDRLGEKLRDALVGLGYLEMNTFTLSSERSQFTKMDLDYAGAVMIGNPLSKDHDCLRVSLIPSLLDILAANKHRELPQRIFEVGDVVIGNANERAVAALVEDAKAGFSDAKAAAEGVMRLAGVDFTIAEEDHPSYIPGRCASILVGGKPVGRFGELHPKVIRAFELRNPVVGFEALLKGLEP